MPSVRLDHLVVRRGLAESGDKAQRLIRAGKILVNGRAAPKPGHLVSETTELSRTEEPHFVGRGGEKLEAAFEAFGLDVRNRVCLDVGASTGGFTDCLLQHGASRVYAVDVGKGQLAWKLRRDPRVTVREGVNARCLRAQDFPERPAVAAVDVSFISLGKVLPAVAAVLKPGGEVVTLIKPQFEAGRRQVGTGGVVRDPAVHEAVVARVRAEGEQDAGLRWIGICPSPLKGPAGNIEFLAHWRKP
jgi:23S rRNA (cytidine1920-2'-O)/16S rRNA (cytidine1409-2'-O)-methyltransferase